MVVSEALLLLPCTTARGRNHDLHGELKRSVFGHGVVAHVELGWLVGWNGERRARVLALLLAHTTPQKLGPLAPGCGPCCVVEDVAIFAYAASP